MKSWKIGTLTKNVKGYLTSMFNIIDVLNNVDHFSRDEIYDLLLQKEQIWIDILVTKCFQKEMKLNKWCFLTLVFLIVYANQYTDL